ncbi:MAG: hypothetical protein K2Y22_14105 [Candidatus Obscuribacterales bacterium]|nr:hypothetical protein [Candidatus Obscuribacterales bacterium]
MKQQVIICHENYYVVSNSITDYAPAKDAILVIDRTTYRVTGEPAVFLRSKPDEDLLKDAAVFVAQLCKDDPDYLRLLTADKLRTTDWQDQLTCTPDRVVVVAVKQAVPQNLFYEVEAKLQEKLKKKQ